MVKIGYVKDISTKLDCQSQFNPILSQWYSLVR